MISLEQVKLLDLKVTRAVDHIKKLTGDNALLRGKLDSYQKRIDDLEILIRNFKDDQNRIEDGILSALDRLNQFEDALQNTLAEESIPAAKPLPAKKPDKPPEKPLQEPDLNPPELDPIEDEEDSGDSENELDIF